MAENILTRKLGPIPTWGWLGIATASGLGLYLYSAKKAASSAASTASPTGTASNTQTPDYVFQNYNQLPQATTQAAAPPPASTPTQTTPAPAGPVTPAPVAQIPPVSNGNPQYQTHNYTGPGGLTLAQIAQRNHNSVAALQTLNPGLVQKYGTTGKIPKGVAVTLPYAK